MIGRDIHDSVFRDTRTMYTAYPNVSPEFAVPPDNRPAPGVRRSDKRSTDKQRKQGSKQHRSWWS